MSICGFVVEGTSPATENTKEALQPHIYSPSGLGRCFGKSNVQEVNTKNVIKGESTLARYADQLEMPVRTLWDYRRVSEAFGKSYRYDFLSWTHHRHLAGREDRHEWLELASQNRWSVYKPTITRSWSGPPNYAGCQ